MVSEAGNFENNSKNKIAQLRAAISRAEAKEDHEEVVLLEAELRATEKGEKFNREEFKIAKARLRVRPKHHVLRDVQNLYMVSEPADDFWIWDGIRHKNEFDVSYEYTFGNILDEIGVKDFQELVERKAHELRRRVKVLDLFGGAYLLSNIDSVSKLVGVRLLNIDEVVLAEQRQAYGDLRSPEELDSLNELTKLIDDPRRIIIEGNLFKKEAWNKIIKTDKEDGGSGFDLIVCRPQGPFGRTKKKRNVEDVNDERGVAREEIFAALLERALKLLSVDGGILFTQAPNFGTPGVILDSFWKRYVSEKQNEGYEFLLGAETSMSSAKVFAIRRKRIDDTK